ncbi:thioredoxin [Geovibrio thiophilus]|uniref:Thioredoxin n=1 Tax=Geovibrio thiophilus TaxID=139438 RepID=A0A3R5XXA3_9BACT|nr:thioredoxin family protein [Geovibrio thiophilus]QAR32971.1 thioredoxin [Geovibrio thiophilus]
MKKIIVPIAVLTAVAVIMVLSLKTGKDGGLTLAMLQAEAAENGRALVVQFSSDGCITCRKMKPALEKIEAEGGERYYVKVIDVDVNSGIAIELGITAVPVQLFISDNGEIMERHLGYLSYKDFTDIFAEHSI